MLAEGFEALGNRADVTGSIAELPNLGPVMAERLLEIGIADEADLRRAGPIDAWRRLRFRFGRAVTRNALYAMEAALLDIDWRQIPPETKRHLDSEAAKFGSGLTTEVMPMPGGDPT